MECMRKCDKINNIVNDESIICWHCYCSHRSLQFANIDYNLIFFSSSIFSLLFVYYFMEMNEIDFFLFCSVIDSIGIVQALLYFIIGHVILFKFQSVCITVHRAHERHSRGNCLPFLLLLIARIPNHFYIVVVVYLFFHLVTYRKYVSNVNK